MFIVTQDDTGNYLEINLNLVKELFLGSFGSHCKDVLSLNDFPFNDNFSFIFHHYHCVPLDIDYQRNRHRLL